MKGWYKTLAKTYLMVLRTALFTRSGAKPNLPQGSLPEKPTNYGRRIAIDHLCPLEWLASDMNLSFNPENDQAFSLCEAREVHIFSSVPK